MFNTKNGFFYRNVSSSVLLLTDLTISTKISDHTKMTVFDSIQIKMIKISKVSGTQKVVRNDFF